MKLNPRSLALAFTLAVLAAFNATAHAQGTAFTYQGRLNFNGSPAAGAFDLRFAVFDTSTNGNQFGGTLTNAATAVTNGLFTVTLDFGAGIFTGPARWLEIAARTNGAATFTTLAPRQSLTPTPYAIFANTASNVLGVVPSSQLTGLISPAQLPANVVTNTQTGVTLGGMLSGNGGGLTNLNASSLATGTVPTNVLAGFQAPFYAVIGGGQNNTANNTYAVVAGGYNNTAGYQATVPGGSFNVASGFYSFAAGQNAQALHQGAFVWADSQPGIFASTGNDTFNVRAQGGVNFQTGGNAVTVNGQPLLTTNSGFFWRTVGNAGTSPAIGNFLGTTDNQPLELRVNNSRALRLEPDTNVFNAPNAIFGSPGNAVASGVYGSFIGGGFANSIASNAHFSFLGTGFQNSIGYAAGSSTIGGGEVNWIESFAGYSTISGGVDNNIQYFAQHATIGGGFLNTIQTNASYATISGGLNNTAGAPGAFVGGGGFDGVDYLGGNRANARSSAIVGGIANFIQTNANYSAIAGGYGNLINGLSSAIGGGYGNIISNNASYCGIGSGFGNNVSAQPFFGTSGAVIGGGNVNSIDTNGTMGYIGGGNYNYLNAFGASIGGGQNNVCSGQFATIPGGDNNVASGMFSFAAGASAQAKHQGAFVWADSQGAVFSSTTSDQFAVRATGGVLLSAGTNNVEIASGGIKVTGAGIGSSTAVFVHRATGANIEPFSIHRTTINNPYCNGDPNAILLVTANYNPSGTGNIIQSHPYGVFYNLSLAKWQIFNEDLVALTTNTAFNVMIVKP